MKLDNPPFVPRFIPLPRLTTVQDATAGRNISMPICSSFYRNGGERYQPAGFPRPVANLRFEAYAGFARCRKLEIKAPEFAVGTPAQKIRANVHVLDKDKRTAR